MCGIAGFVGKIQGWQNEIKGMCDRMQHRGPDAANFWSDDYSEAVMGHRRLAILDLSDDGIQPMMSQNERFVISFNGEIYNYKLIADRLSINNHVVFHTKTDTEVLLEAIAAWGVVDALKEVRGMFAFAVYDRKDKILYLARDRVGEKPLYYGWVGSRFVFASDLACIEKLQDFRNRINLHALKIYFQHGYIPAPYSIYEDIYKLDPGMVMVVDGQDGNEKRKVPYWSMEEVALQGIKNPFKGSMEEAADELKKLLMESVSMQMLADVPVGAFLSAGIDSTTIVALMQEISSIPVKTFTIGVESPKFNEAVAAREIAAVLGTNHTELYISESEAQEIIPQLGYYYSEPFADSSQIPTMLVSKLARQGVTVSLSGDGGDELFAGYNYYTYVNHVWNQMLRLPAPARQIGGWIFNNVPLVKDSHLAEHGKVLRCRCPEDVYNFSRKQACIDRIFRKEVEAYSKNDLSRRWIMDECQQNIMLMDLQMYHPDDILVKVDRAAMAYSLETRIPMLDADVIRFAWSLPFSYKKSGGVTKRVLRKILYQYVPEEIMDRPKTGFSVPLNEWLREEKLRNWAEDLLRCRKLMECTIFIQAEINKLWDNYCKDGIWTETIWRLLIFAQWLEQKQIQSVQIGGEG